MKRLNISIAIFLLIATVQLFSAKNIIVQSGATSTAYETLVEAIAGANNGDIVYVSAGSYDVNNLEVNKGVHIIGAGYNPYTASATGNTVFTGTLRIMTGADGGSLQGVYVSGSISFGTSDENSTVNNYTISRCYVNTIMLSWQWAGKQSGSNFTITENVIEGAVYGGDATNLVFSNNILFQTATLARPITYFKNALVTNNILISVDDVMGNMVTGTTFRNNIIPVGGLKVVNSYSDNLYLNNLYCRPEGLFSYGVVQSVGNVLIDRDKLFINQAGDKYNFKDNYHLTQEATEAITGTDGTEVGIYGGDYPFKDGGAPLNPQIIEKNVSTSTNPQGHLKVEIKVKAQNK